MPFTYRFRFTDDFLIAAMSKYRSQVWWRRQPQGSNWLWALVFAGSFALCVAYQLRWPAIAFAAAFGALVVGWPVDKALLRWRFRKSPYRDDDLELTLSDEGVFIKGNTAEMRLSWSVFTKARRFEDGLLLFQGPHLFNWLPDTAAVEPTTPGALLELVRRHVNDFREV
jgi:hypothetical protein